MSELQQFRTPATARSFLLAELLSMMTSSLVLIPLPPSLCHSPLPLDTHKPAAGSWARSLAAATPAPSTEDHSKHKHAAAAAPSTEDHSKHKH